ncbi:integrase [Pseudomonas plecoglossicida]|uniref:Integrase n=1 Tax=Pseudomonas plecoglossicida TaxID=70775 RepID=A0A2A3M3S6_PSEDL|nr:MULTISPECIES: DDE-type integrase/transposase/recombinase [Pseudomonas]KSO44964.1 transposase [Pseudomonas aeruginosa]MBI7752239.1 transposase family protein [Pseudomonas aeruginosa]PBJ94723.1 integrase [Pseudomonas plecoglossicida]
MNAVVTQRLVDLARAVEVAPHGQRTELCRTAAVELGMSLPTIYRKLREVTVNPPRKRRTDAGQTTLSEQEAYLISALLLESIRANNKQLSTVERAVERLRSNGKILAGRVDEKTGEFVPLSISSITRALRTYRLHPDQLLQPEPAVSLASRHPNHVWQIDASISTQFYLDDDGAKTMNQAEFYDGKPTNLKKIERKRLWRYVITDHTSGTIYVQYVLGAESAENLCNVLICCMQKRGENDPFHGVPFIIMTDPGAAMTSAIFRNLCKALSIELIINKVGNARAKGQVEQAHNIVEREFESALKLQKAETLEQINGWAGQWMRYHNATAIHTRHRRTRYGQWLTVQADQLRLAPSVEVCRELAVTAPETRKVNDFLQVSYRGGQFDVSSIPQVMVGDTLLITRNPWRDEDSAQVVLTNEDGREAFHVVERIAVDANGFKATSAIIGETFKSHADTPAQKARKTIEQLVTGSESQEEAAAARKARALPFNGEIDPHKHITDTVLPSYMPRRGVASPITTPTVEIQPLSHVEAAKLLRGQMGSAWTADSMAWLKSSYPNGVPEDQIDAITQQLRAPARPGLRVVGGNA